MKKILIIIIVVMLSILFLSSSKTNTKWNFVGYQYRWSKDYVENTGLNSELECVQYGEIWIKKQRSEEVLYTCSSGCKKDAVAPGIDECKKICEYERNGLVRCRE